jgi:cobalt-zinc-cadmium efflux system outer membrane protein
MSHTRILTTFCLFSMALPLVGEAVPVITMAGIPNRVRSHNPELAAARLHIDEALGRMKQAGRLPNPGLETAIEGNTRFREGRIEVGISQQFPVTDRLRLEKDLSATELRAAEAEVEEVARKLVRDARMALVDVLAVRQRKILLTQQVELARELADLLAKTALAGEGSSLDAGQARLECATLELEIRQLDAAEAAATGALVPLLGMSPGQALSVQGSLSDPAIPGDSPVATRRPDLRAAMLDAEAAGQAVGVEQSLRHEDVEAGVFAAAERSEDAPVGFENETIVGLRFKIPLPFRKPNEGRIEAARALAKRKQLEATALGRSIDLEVEHTRNEMREWLKVLNELDQTLVPLADAQSEAAADAYRAGQGDLQSVFRSREKQLRLKASRIDALHQFHLARVRHQAASGGF